MPEVAAALITALVGLVSSGALAALEQRVLGRRARREREVVTSSGFGPFTWAWGTALIVGVAAAVLVVVTRAPSENDLREGNYVDFFATSAQITAALIIALAIEAGQTRSEDVTAFRLEACLCVALGAVAALAGLVPGLPQPVYAAALMMIPPGVIGGLVGVVAIAVSRRRDVAPNDSIIADEPDRSDDDSEIHQVSGVARSSFGSTDGGEPVSDARRAQPELRPGSRSASTEH